MESCDSCCAGDGRAWKVYGRAQALVAMSLLLVLKDLAISKVLCTLGYI